MARFSVLHRSVIAGVCVVFLSKGEGLTLHLTAITLHIVQRPYYPQIISVVFKVVIMRMEKTVI